MSIQKSDAILLRKHDLRETSLILTFYTRDFGKVKGVMKGVRGPHTSHGGRFEIFAHDQVVFYDRKRGDLCTISGCELVEFFAPVRESLDKLAYATYIAELLDAVTTPGDSHPDVFELALGTLRILEQTGRPKELLRVFEIKLLGLLGLEPILGVCAHCGTELAEDALFSYRHGGLICKACRSVDVQAQALKPGTLAFIRCVRSSDLDKLTNVLASPETANELEWVLRKFLDYHIDHRLRSVEFIKLVEE